MESEELEPGKCYEDITMQDFEEFPSRETLGSHQTEVISLSMQQQGNCVQQQHGDSLLQQQGNLCLQQQQRRQKILMLICLNLLLQVIIMKTLQNQQAALVSITNFMGLMNVIQIDKRLLRLDPRSIWRLDRESPFVDRTLINSHSEKEFVRRLRVKRTTFLYICSVVAPAMHKCKKGGGIALEKRVALALTRLGTGNYLLGCADLFGMSEALACIVVRQFCQAVLQIIRPLVVPRWTEESMARLSQQFEEKHGIPYIIGAIDGSHIPIIAPHGDPAPFYNRKGFYSVLLQGIVDTETIFWDWDFGWAGSLHDYTLFVNSREGMNLLAGKYKPYKFIGDAAYPIRTCMYVPFKGNKVQLDPVRAHWNFIQSSTRMSVERAFGILKGRWRILLRRIEMKLENVADVVGACICLHNLCVMHKDFVDNDLLEEAKKWLVNEQIGNFGNLREAGTMSIVDYGKDEVQRVSIDVDELLAKTALAEESDSLATRAEQESHVLGLKEGVTMHWELAKTLFAQHLREQVPLPEGYFESESESD